MLKSVCLVHKDADKVLGWARIVLQRSYNRLVTKNGNLVLAGVGALSSRYSREGASVESLDSVTSRGFLERSAKVGNWARRDTDITMVLTSPKLPTTLSPTSAGFQSSQIDSHCSS